MRGPLPQRTPAPPQHWLPRWAREMQSTLDGEIELLDVALPPTRVEGLATGARRSVRDRV